MSDEELFDHLAETIRAEKLFLDNNFGRDFIMTRFHLSERQVGAAFSKGSPYASIADFSRELRLEYACQLLTECPDMSISEIATTCGYGSPVAFNRAFKAKYEITPSYYREQVNG
jgi:AraC family transcriptional regulator